VDSIRDADHTEVRLLDSEYAKVGEAARFVVGDVASTDCTGARAGASYEGGASFIGVDVARISPVGGSTSKAEIGVASSSGLRRPRVARHYLGASSR